MTNAPPYANASATISARDVPSSIPTLAADFSDKRLPLRIARYGESEAIVEQLGIGQIQQPLEGSVLFVGQLIVVALDEAPQKQIELEQTAATTPACAFTPLRIDHDDATTRQVTRLTSNSRMCPIAFVGFKPFGQTSVQFMIV